MINIPNINLGIVAVSRDCFPIELSQKRRGSVVAECEKKGIRITEIETTVENGKDALLALDELKTKNVNALVVFLGNFGPEGPETLLAQRFNGPVMFVAAAEESGDNLINGRGDAYCGMLNASYSLNLRGVKAYIPEYPVGTASEVAAMIGDFFYISRVIVGLKGLKLQTFGPRPQDFIACNAPIKPLFDLGVEIMENSELDLFESYKNHAGDPRIAAIADDMAKEVNKDNSIYNRLAQYELTLNDWIADNAGESKYVAMANKCWPAFQREFKFVPCYVNSRFAARGIPIACETDIYGALTEYMITCATGMAPTLLDINNTVPADMYEANKAVIGAYSQTDLFMGFHCGNTPICYIDNPSVEYQLIMHRSLEPNKEPDITRGTLEGNIKASDITLFRLQGTADSKLTSYIAEGEVLDLDCKSFGSIGVFAIPEMGRFYRHVLVGGHYPHHAGVAFKKTGKILFAVLKMLGIEEIGFNQPKGMLYKDENPFR